MHSPPLIQLSHCSVILDEHPVLDDVSFTLRRGERWALVGPNGAGKTLLLKLLRGDMWPTPTGRERRRYCFDCQVQNEPRDLKYHIAYVGPERQDKYERYGWDLRVEQIVTTGLFDEDIPLTTPTAAQRAHVDRMLKRFSLWGLRKRRILTLSYGQRRLVLVARAFAGPAEVLLLDEVFNGLDARVKRKLREALERPREKHSWVLTTHRAHELPSNVTHRAFIEAGRLSVARPVSNLPPRGGERKQGVRPLPHPPPRGRGGERMLDAAESQPHVRRRAGEIPSPAMRGRAREGADSSLLFPFPAMRGPLTRIHALPRHSHIHVHQRVREGAKESVAERATSQAPWLIRISSANVYRDYRPVIRDLNWTVRKGEHWAVLGANGSGKSTLLSMIHGDLQPALGGRIERAGLSKGEHIEHWKRRVGWMSPELQAAHFQVSSLEEIVISGRYASVGLNQAPTRADRAIGRRLLKFFNLDALRARGPRQVSYGQLRLALIARAMVNDPELLLLDEPCSGLDGDVRAYVIAVINELAKRGVQLIMAVHDPEDLPPAVDHVLRIRRGGRVQFGKMEWPQKRR